MTPAHQLFNQRLKQQQLQLRLTVAVLVTWVFTMLTSVHKDSETALFLLDEWLALSLREISIFSMTHLAKDWEEFLYNFCSTLKTVNLPRGQRLSRFTCTTLLSRPLVSWQIIIAKLLRLEELLINLHLLLFWIFYIHNSDSAFVANSFTVTMTQFHHRWADDRVTGSPHNHSSLSEILALMSFWPLIWSTFYLHLDVCHTSFSETMLVYKEIPCLYSWPRLRQSVSLLGMAQSGLGHGAWCT